MTIKSANTNLTFRKLKISDYNKFKNLFYSCFKKEISYNFFKWRYFNDKLSFCYGVFDSLELIANVGLKAMKVNNKRNERVFSRHSSMVSVKYRGIGIFSRLLSEVKKNFSKDANIILMWPNKNNFASFGIDKKRIVKKKYYLYQTSLCTKKLKKTNNFDINHLNKFKHFIQSDNNFLCKNFSYFNNRYFLYKKKEYFLNVFEFKKAKSFFIIKKNKDKLGFNFVILDHFGSKSIKSKHLEQVINDEGKIIFWSKKKINKIKYKLIDYINVNIGFIEEINLKKKIAFFKKKEFMLGDTDSFISLN